MSSASEQPRPEPGRELGREHRPVHEDPTTPVMSHPAGRRRGRLVLPAVFVLAIVVVFLIIVLVGHLA